MSDVTRGTPLDSWLLETPDGRRWRVEDFGPGRVKVTDIDSPTGYHEWVDRARLMEARSR